MIDIDLSSFSFPLYVSRTLQGPAIVLAVNVRMPFSTRFLPVAVAWVLAIGCGGKAPTNSSPTQPTLPDPAQPTLQGGFFQGHVAAVLTDNPSVPAVAIDTNGDRLAAITGGPEAEGGAVFTRGDHRITVYRRADGRPARMVADDVLFVFERYTATTVDVAVIASDGQVHIVRNIAFSTLPAFTQSVSTQSLNPSLAAISGTSLNQFLKDSANLISFAACLVTIGTPMIGGPALVLLALPEIAAACGSTLILVLNQSGVLDSLLSAAFENAQNAQLIADLLVAHLLGLLVWPTVWQP